MQLKDLVSGVAYFSLGFIISLAVISGAGQIGYQPQGYVGSSMDPTYEAGCNLGVETTNVDPTQIEEGDIITYQGSEKRIVHRIHKKYESYTTGPHNTHYINSNGNFVVNNGNEVLIKEQTVSNQTYEDYAKLDGETVFIAKGDNNPSVDPILLTESDIDAQPVFVVSVPDIIPELIYNPQVCD